jgi:dethiobiotin synthetase
MMPIVVTGTDTAVGKTVFASALVQALGASYWKPVQAGLAPPTDSQTVARLSGASPDRILPEAYRLEEPIAPHLAARHMSLALDPDRLALPEVDGPLVIEGAGGVLVPVTANLLFADLFAFWRSPVVLVARTALGTISHSLLAIEALRARGVSILGIAFIGAANEESEESIAEIGGVKYLGRLPRIEPLDAPSLARAFADNFDPADFAT